MEGLWNILKSGRYILEALGRLVASFYETNPVGTVIVVAVLVVPILWGLFGRKRR